MQLITTLSEKGQIVIPKSIRKKLNIGKSDKFTVKLGREGIILSPIMSSDDAMGMFKAKNPITKKDIKNSYKRAVQKKHK